jgi:NADH-quinone oxidoreductase subunit L
MHGDPGQRRYFVFLDAFVAAMGLLVLAGSLVVLLVGWVAVGLSSFLLISFWRDRPGTLRAGLEALAASAVGDGALLAAVLMLPAGAGDLTSLAGAMEGSAPGGTWRALLPWLLLVAASAKSAQGPLYFWLPSAMAGPTPISALIHAATMVAAGVYLLVRTAPALDLAPDVLATTAILGTAMALLGATASLRQAQLKRGLAYSTISQLGFMFAAVGFGAPFAALFHLVTHAAFKALLFLSAGVVIHATGEERLSHLGGLRRDLPGAAAAFAVGAMCLIGVPVLTSGAFSKDLILEAGIARQPVLGWSLVLSVLLTGLYIGRLYAAVFSGPARGAPAHRPAALMAVAMAPLGAAALLAGYVAWPDNALGRVLAPSIGTAPGPHLVSATGVVAAALGLLGFAAGARLGRAVSDQSSASAAPPSWVERGARLVAGGSALVARLHDGRVGRYVLSATLGVAFLLYLTMRPIW